MIERERYNKHCDMVSVAMDGTSGMVSGRSGPCQVIHTSLDSVHEATNLLSPTEGTKGSGHSIRWHLWTSVPHGHIPTTVLGRCWDTRARGCGHRCFLVQYRD